MTCGGISHHVGRTRNSEKHWRNARNSRLRAILDRCMDPAQDRYRASKLTCRADPARAHGRSFQPLGRHARGSLGPPVSLAEMTAGLSFLQGLTCGEGRGAGISFSSQMQYPVCSHEGPVPLFAMPASTNVGRMEIGRPETDVPTGCPTRWWDGFLNARAITPNMALNGSTDVLVTAICLHFSGDGENA